MKGRIHSKETFGTVDGPGIRYVVFFQGCPLRCKFCHNRDTWERQGGKEVELDELVRDVLAYKSFIDASGGGVTATGGEPLLQAEFIAAWFGKLKQRSIHTALDTSGYGPVGSKVDALLDQTDLVLLDLKHMDDGVHRDLVGVPNGPVFAFAEHLAQRGDPVWLRHVVVPGYSDDLNHAAALADYAAGLGNVARVELLPYHEMGAHKWEALGLRYELAGTPPPDGALMERIAKVFRARKLEVSLSSS